MPLFHVQLASSARPNSSIRHPDEIEWLAVKKGRFGDESQRKHGLVASNGPVPGFHGYQNAHCHNHVDLHHGHLMQVQMHNRLFLFRALSQLHLNPCRLNLNPFPGVGEHLKAVRRLDKIPS
jgi:hypothetical protein